MHLVKAVILSVTLEIVISLFRMKLSSLLLSEVYRGRGDSIYQLLGNDMDPVRPSALVLMVPKLYGPHGQDDNDR